MRHTTSFIPLILVAIGLIGSQRATAEEKEIELFKAVEQGDVSNRTFAKI